MKYGKKPATHDTRDLLFAQYRDHSVAIHVPRTFGHQKLIGNWGMLGNDQYGDCVFAGADHEVMLWNAASGHAIPTFTSTNALTDYGAVTGFSQTDPNSDQGTNVRDALNYRRKTGTVDGNGTRHKIGAYLAIEPSNITEVLQAAWLFSAVGIGFQCPDYLLDEFNAGKPWTIRPGKHSIEGGHYVPVVGAVGNYLFVVTWGKVQKMSFSFFEKYCDEAYAILSEEYLNSQGESPEGFSYVQLINDLHAL